jgi:hypothetical protein
MVLILLIFAAIVVTISVTRRHSSFGSSVGSRIAKENFPIVGERAEQSGSAGQTRQFWVVVLPDGKVVNPMVADCFVSV